MLFFLKEVNFNVTFTSCSLLTTLDLAGMIPKSADEHAIKTVFEPFGDIEEVIFSFILDIRFN